MTAITVRLAVPLTEPLLAWTVAEPLPVLGAVYRPELLIVPRPEANDHVNAGCVVRAFPNWSLAEAENCCVAPSATLALAGETAMLVGV